MSKVFIEDTTLTNIGNAIRTKTGKSELLLPSEMPKEIESISGGGTPLPVPPVKPTLNDYTWDEINQISALGATDDTVWERYNLHVGDSKAVEMSGNTYSTEKGIGYVFSSTENCFITGFNHNKELEGTGISFCVGRNEQGQDISYHSFSSGFPNWWKSPMRWSCQSFFLCLPDDLKKVIKLTKKYTFNNDESGQQPNSIYTTDDYIFYISEYELMGNISVGYSEEADFQQQYEYYKTHSPIKKGVGDVNPGYENSYLLRSLNKIHYGKPSGFYVSSVDYFENFTQLGASYNFKV